MANSKEPIIVVSMAESYQYLWDIINCAKQGKELPIDRINLSGSRKSAKTWSLIVFITIMCLLFKTKVYAVRNMKTDTYELLKQFLAIIDTVPGLKAKMVVNKTRQSITFPNGSVIEVIGLHRQTSDEANISGLSSANGFKYAIAFGEERYQISDKEWGKLGQAIRGAEEYIEVHAANPWVKDNDYVAYMDKELMYDLETMKKYGEQFIQNGREITHYTNYMVNEYLSKKEIDRLKRDAALDPHTMDTVLYGKPGILEGSIWQYVIGKMLRELEPEDSPIEFIGGVDYGEMGDACTAYVGGFSSNMDHVHIDHEYYWANRPGRKFKDTNVLAKEIVEHFIEFYENEELNQILYVEVDQSSIPFTVALNTAATEFGYEDVIQFVRSKKHGIEERIEQIKTMAAFGMITIDPSCVELIREYQGQTYSGKKTPYRLGDDHGTDTVEYILAKKWVRLLDNLALKKLL